MIATRDDQNLIGTIARLELTEAALGEVTRIAVEQIHSGLESTSHVEAAERDMSSALRPLVLAERELRSRSGLRTSPAWSPRTMLMLRRAQVLTACKAVLNLVLAADTIGAR
jgi:hypothetical protein